MSIRKQTYRKKRPRGRRRENRKPCVVFGECIVGKRYVTFPDTSPRYAGKTLDVNSMWPWKVEAIMTYLKWSIRVEASTNKETQRNIEYLSQKELEAINLLAASANDTCVDAQNNETWG